jgi:DNA-binding NarL/FixJ family response regulator
MLRVLLVIEVPFYREGLKRLLSQDGGITVIGGVWGHEAVEAVIRENPALVLLDISPPAARHWFDRLRELCDGLKTRPKQVVGLSQLD